jgi:hypothetical protein
MDSDNQKKINTVVQNYNREVKKLLNIVDYLIPDNPKVYIIIRVFNMVKRENPSMIIERGVDKLWDNKDHILNKDVEFFKKSTGAQYIKDDSNKEWLTELISMLKDEYENLNEKEIDMMWTGMKNLLEYVIQFKLLKQDYQ